MCNTPRNGSPSHLMRRLRSGVSFFFFFPQTRTCSSGIHHQGMGCNKYEHQCRTTDTSTRPCPSRLSLGYVSDPRRPLRFEFECIKVPSTTFFSPSADTVVFSAAVGMRKFNFFNMLLSVYKCCQVSDNIPKLFSKHGASLCVSVR